MNKILIAFLLVWVGLSTAYSQNTRSATNPKPPKPQYQAAKKEKKDLFAFLKKEQGSLLKSNEEERAAFRKRVSEAYRENAKIEYKAEKVQRREAKKGEKFFGHKRPPKKRPPGKQKFCKVCRIWH